MLEWGTLRIPNFFQQVAPTIPVQFETYCRPGNQKMPPLDTQRLLLQTFIQGEARVRLSTPTDGDATFLLRYKGAEGAVMSIEERDGGAEWRIIQVQGSRSSKSYRLTLAFEWQRFFADRLMAYAEHPSSDVQCLTMVPPHSIKNVTASDNLEGALSTYSIVQSRLGMQRSQETDLYIVTIRDKVARVVHDPMFSSGDLHS
jgi:hypothetical protein